VVIILGLANLVADGISMGIGNFLSLRSERDHYQKVAEEERREIAEDPKVEREEIREIYAQKGFTGEELEHIVERITSNREVWVQTMMCEEHGLTTEGTELPALHGSMTFLSFLIFGAIPLLPYFFALPSAARFHVAVSTTAVALALLGSLRSWVTKQRPIRGALEILVLGAVAAAAAYIVGVLLRGLVSS
jgi:VIT1/CCC1 family predicted Fe2+/Mn2+ transporter